MSAFLKAALPWVVMGLCVAFCAAGYFSQKKKKAKADKSDNPDASEETYLLEGMCYGMCVGMCFSSLLNQGLAMGICLGAACGMLIGMRVPKKKKSKK